MSYITMMLTLILTGQISAIAADMFYYSRDTRIDLTVNPEFVVARMQDTAFSDWTTFLQQFSFADTVTVPIRLKPNLYKFLLAPLADPIQVVAELRSDVRVAFASPSYFKYDTVLVIPTGRMIVHFRSDVPLGTIDSLVVSHSVIKLREFFDNDRWLLLHLTQQTATGAVEVANIYQSTGLISYAEPDFMQRIELDSDPYSQYQWQFYNTGQYGGVVGADIDMPGADQYFAPNYPLLVAFLDDGFEAHEDFPAERLADGYDYADEDDEEVPDGLGGSHGMLVMGSMAAVTNNSIGIRGVLRNNWRVLGQRFLVQGQVGPVLYRQSMTL